MIKIYKTNSRTGITQEIKEVEKNCWINIIKPTENEIKKISDLINAELNNNDKIDLNSYLDEEEQARTEAEENYIAIVIDIPTFEKHTTYNLSVTVPLIIIQVKDDYIITMCTKETDMFNEFLDGKIKSFYTEKKSRFTMQIILKVASDYIKELKKINEETNKSEKSLKKSTSNNDLLRLMHIQKSLVYFTTSLKSNDVVLEKLQKTNLMPLYDEDMDVLEDAIIENKQAIEMASIYTSILRSTIDVFGMIISNNLDKIMKFLAGFTIVISIPTIVASFMGMNVPLGIFNNNPYSFLMMIIISTILSLIAAHILKKKNML